MANTTTDGQTPQASLVADASGNVYGTTIQGGTAGAGTVFELSPPATAGGPWTETILHNFTGGADGMNPSDGLAFDHAGNLFGATYYGGVGVNGNSFGTVYELSPSGGTWTYSVIFSFDDAQVANSPFSNLVFDQAGNLYGVSNGFISSADCGGPCGNVFQLRPPAVTGGAWTGRALHAFNGHLTDGYRPNGVILIPGGTLYGTTNSGGTNHTGTFFKLTPPATSGGGWTETILFNFPTPNGYPVGLILGGNGTFFGTADSGFDFGEIFQMIPPSSGGDWTESVLYTFPSRSEGVAPVGGLLRDRRGNLFGATQYGGTVATDCFGVECGLIYELSPPAFSGGAWTKTTLHNFTGDRDGSTPTSALIFVKGVLFGETDYGGTQNSELGGTVFRLVP
jgi:uncharacterized repeat protein (TIGR03803 family)